MGFPTYRCASLHISNKCGSSSHYSHLLFSTDIILITSISKKQTSDLKLDLIKEFEMADLGHISYFFEIDLYKKIRGLLMHQRIYAGEILKIFKMEHCNSAVTSTEPKLYIIEG